MKIVVLNGAKVNFDGIIDYSVLAEESDQLVVFETCEDHKYADISEGAEVMPWSNAYRRYESAERNRPFRASVPESQTCPSRRQNTDKVS